MNPQNGKGSTQRPESIPGAYAEGYERIFSAESRQRIFEQDLARVRSAYQGMEADSAKEGAP